jgi:folate/biopterin transporter
LLKSMTVLSSGLFTLRGRGQRQRAHIHEEQESKFCAMASSGEDGFESTELSARERAPFRHHMLTRRFFSGHGWSKSIPLFGLLCEKFGVYFVCMIGCTYLVNKGITAHVLAAASLPLFKGEFGVDVALYQRIVAVGFMAWSMKPLIAVSSDLITFWGFHKRYFLLMAESTCCVVLFLLSVSPRGGSHHAAVVAGVMLFLANFCCAVLDILPEGRYSELIAHKPEAGSAMVSWVWSCVMIGGGAAALFHGPLADAGYVRISLLIAMVSQGLLFFPLTKNWFGERSDRTVSGQCASFSTSKFLEHQKLTFLAIGMSVGILVSAFAALFLDSFNLLCITATVAVALTGCSALVLPKTAALANIFMFLKELLYVQLPGPLDYFYTADESCLADGPHFSYAYYQTFTVIIGYGAGVLGVTLFHKVFSTKCFRYVFWCTAGLKIIASVVDFAIVKRWNRYLGLGDHTSYLLGDAIVFGVCQMLDFMPAVILTSRLCPKGMEATMYAILAGFSNLGQALSNTTGSLLVEFVWPVVTTPPCDFSNLPILLFVCHGLLPMLIFPLSLLMVPDASICEELS